MFMVYKENYKIQYINEKIRRHKESGMINEKDGYILGLCVCPDSYFVLIIPVPLVLLDVICYRKHWNFDVGAF